MLAKAKGILAHKFHGTYWAVIGLQFDNHDHAIQSLAKLGRGWKLGEKSNKVLVWQGESEALGECKKLLASFGADPDKIDSVETSIDYGEWFEVEIPIDDVNQLRFAL